MKKTTYFYRNPEAGFSIAKVFHTITDEIRKEMPIEELEVPCLRADPLSIIKNIWYVYKHRNKDGINHITGHIHYVAIGLIGCKSVLTIHDTSPYDCCKNPVKRMIMSFLWFYLPILLCDKVVCISEKTKNDISRFTRRKDIHVIYNPVSPILKFEQKKMNISAPTILHLGTGWNKNLINTAKALTDLPCTLRIIGRLDEQQIMELDKLAINYVPLCNLTDLEIYQEYLNSDIICFCSIFEGFGMPIIEGNSVGRCVITSDIPPLNEIGKDAVCYADPNTPESIKTAILKVISDEEFRDNLIKNGLKNIELYFNVEKISQQYISLYLDFSHK